MRQFAAAVLWSWAAYAQTLVPQTGMAAAAAKFQPRDGEAELRCSVDHAQPLLNFGLQFRSMYRVALPLDQFSGPGRTGGIALRVTPEGGAPAYLLSRFELGPLPSKTDNDALMGGEFFTGEGRYLVEFALSDDLGRVCRKQWRVETRRQKDERRLRLALQPGAIVDAPAASAATLRIAGAAPPRRITLLMNASEPASVMPLLGSLLERFPRTAIRFTSFVLGRASSTAGRGRGPRRGRAPQEPRELFHRDRLTSQDLGDLTRAIDPLAHWAVDYRDLVNENGHWDLLADLIRRETVAQPADALIFLGVRHGVDGKPPARFLETEAAAGRRVFYLQYTGFPEVSSLGIARMPLWQLRRGQIPAFGTDGIQLAVSRLHGKTFRFYSPAGFANAIEAINQAAAR